MVHLTAGGVHDQHDRRTPGTSTPGSRQVVPEVPPHVARTGGIERGGSAPTSAARAAAVIRPAGSSCGAIAA
jgi:hypothetical protein